LRCENMLMLMAPPVIPASLRAERPYVLLVDDHGPTLRLLCEVVKSAGHRCATASSAREAIACVDAQRPQVVVTDLAMPNLDGLGLASWLHPRFPSVPLILLTGQKLDSDATAALGRTFTAVLSKPVNVPWFLDRLERMMPPARFLEPTLTAPRACPYDAIGRVTRGVAQPG
jgi:CheY-like chemotaxis protein